MFFCPSHKSFLIFTSAQGEGGRYVERSSLSHQFTRNPVSRQNVCRQIRRHSEAISSRPFFSTTTFLVIPGHLNRFVRFSCPELPIRRSMAPSVSSSSARPRRDSNAGSAISQYSSHGTTSTGGADSSLSDTDFLLRFAQWVRDATGGDVSGTWGVLCKAIVDGRAAWRLAADLTTSGLSEEVVENPRSSVGAVASSSRAPPPPRRSAFIPPKPALTKRELGTALKNLHDHWGSGGAGAPLERISTTSTSVVFKTARARERLFVLLNFDDRTAKELRFAIFRRELVHLLAELRETQLPVVVAEGDGMAEGGGSLFGKGWMM